MSDKLRKSVQDLTLGIDDEPVALTPEFCSQAAHVNRFSLVVTTVNPRKQNLRALIGQIPTVWGFPDSCVGRILDRGKVQFKFQTEEAMNLVLRRGPWSFNYWMLSIHRWYPNITEAEMKIIPFWVQITDGENTVIKFRFERLRNFCSKCGSLKHDVKECTLAFDDEDPAVISEDDDDDNDEDHQDDNKDKDMSDTDALQTVDPVTLIPRLQASIPRETQSNVMKRPISSAFLRAFEDTDLNVERLRYLHAKLARVRTHTPVESDLLLDSSDNAQNPFVFMKRKRVQFEQLFQEVEEAEEMAVLSHLCKKERKTESAGSCSIHGVRFPLLLGDTYQFKPPWQRLYIIFLSSLLVPQSQSTSPQTNSSVIMSDKLRKSVQDLTLGIDDEPVALTPEFCSQAAHVNRFSLVVTTVNPRKQNLRALIGQIPTVWGFPDSCVGRILDRGKVQFKFQTEEAMNLVLRRGPWSFNYWMLSIHRWYPNITEAEMKIIPFWVQITDGENTVIKFRFERLRNFCSKCGSLKHDVKECTLAFDDEDPAVISEDDDDDNDEDHQDDNKDKDMSDTDALQTVDPITLIPRLQASIPRETQSNVMKRPISSAFLRAFEDTDLNVERLRYLHAKLARVRTHTPVESDLLLDSSDNAQNPFVFMKRKRVQFEQLFQEVEEAEEMAVLSHLCKKERKTESAGSCSIHGGIDRGAGAPVPPRDPI
ncbi:Zinc knuckle CX2CX4HX4C [Arabidopsis thaliana x Arabidopsis arenosa]|uniref:Zinc knuckle CX2CX4HX4C n=1 Tax=Arabidopsis thaliana x Arabidopsis arenosa TaxID=1240361 RepID=A0A8T2GMB9_9BRAS|nr:Zinc knuckle CX2CX4HX4C [Arabidopsis thaliana x Arabidopsis arenosa]